MHLNVKIIYYTFWVGWTSHSLLTYKVLILYRYYDICQCGIDIISKLKF